MPELRISPEIQTELKNMAQSYKVTPSEMLKIMLQHMKLWDECLKHQYAPQFKPALKNVLERYAQLLPQEEPSDHE